MINLLQSIVDTIVSVVQFLIHFFDTMINFVAHIPTYVTFLTSSIANLPAIIMPYAIASVSVYVVFMIINRGK